MCSLPYSHLPALWVLSWLLPAWALSRVTSTAWAWSAAATRSSCRLPSSRLIRLAWSAMFRNSEKRAGASASTTRSGRIGRSALALPLFAAAIMDLAGPALCRLALVRSGECREAGKAGRSIV